MRFMTQLFHPTQPHTSGRAEDCGGAMLQGRQTLLAAPGEGEGRVII